MELNAISFLKLLNKTKISISNDDTRHYLNGIFLHLTESHGRNFLTAVATDSHRLSSSSIVVTWGKLLNAPTSRLSIKLLSRVSESMNISEVKLLSSNNFESG